MVRDPDRPRALLCPVTSRGVMRLGYQERIESERLLVLAFGDESAPGHEFPASDATAWPADTPDAADDWWIG
jgi:hypothetical protein